MTLYAAVRDALNPYVSVDDLNDAAMAVTNAVVAAEYDQRNNPRPVGACPRRTEMWPSGSQSKTLRYCRYDYNHTGAHRAIGDDGYTWTTEEQQ